MLERAIGLMSGTSADGIDAVLVRFEGGRFCAVEAHHSQPYPDAIRARLLALGRAPQAAIPLHELASLDAAVGQHFADAAIALLQQAGSSSRDIAVIGSHGQTIFHDPRGARSSWQIGDANIIAARLGCPVAADFRRLDVALGGEGAPLVPAFHQAVFTGEAPVSVVNIGGIANITELPPGDGTVRGFDCGPGNALMDEWASLQTGEAFDRDGALAARGVIDDALLGAWLAEPYFSLPPPKSTGRAQFNLDWLDARTPGWRARPAADVQATLCALTARSIVGALAPETRRVLICGGGAANPVLMRQLRAALDARFASPPSLETTAEAGLHPQWVEAAAFAWLGLQRLHGRVGNCMAVTGATRRAVLGALYSGVAP